MKKVLYLIYGGAAYSLFLVCIILTIAFSAGIPGAKGFLPARYAGLPAATLINLGLVGLFALQHSLMARKSIKQMIRRLIPRELVRSTYVLLSSLILIFLLWQWRLIPGEIWHIQNQVIHRLVYLIQASGWILLILATFQIDHFELFGLRQVYLAYRQRVFPAPVFKTPWLYRFVRHPMMSGLLLALWFVPEMRIDRLLFSIGLTVYIAIGLYLEEKDLVKDLGEPYRDYQRQIPRLLPIKFAMRSEGQNREYSNHSLRQKNDVTRPSHQ